MPDVKSYIQFRLHGVGSYKFAKVPFPNFEPYGPDDVHIRTVTGALSSSYGAPFMGWNAILRIPYTTETIDGLSSISLQDLMVWMGSKNASDRTLDFKPFDQSQVYQVRFTKPYTVKYIVPVINNSDSYFLVPITIETVLPTTLA